MRVCMPNGQKSSHEVDGLHIRSDTASSLWPSADTHCPFPHGCCGGMVTRLMLLQEQQCQQLHCRHLFHACVVYSCGNAPCFHLACVLPVALRTNSNNRDIQDAVAALVRHVCLKAPDKADCRAAAVKAVTDLVTDLPQWEQEQFAGFVFNLSRTNKVSGWGYEQSVAADELLCT